VKIRSTLKELGTLAVDEIGFCNGIYWKSAVGSRVPEGHITANCRLAYIIFSGFAPAQRFATLLDRRQVERLPRETIRSVVAEYGGVKVVGVAVIAVLSPNREHATGIQRAPRMDDQPGYHRYFRQRAARGTPQRPWWDHDLGDDIDGRGFDVSDLQPGREYAERQADEELERELDRLEAEFDEKLWWYGTPGRRSKYPPQLGSVRELFAYARKQELDLEEFARRNRERQAEQWLTAEYGRERSHRQELDADQDEVAAALHTPRPGIAHQADQDWLTTEQVLKARKGLRAVYRDAVPRPRRQRSA
jgi:hypothetical protein